MTCLVESEDDTSVDVNVMCLVNGQVRNSGSVPPLYIPLLHRRHRPVNNENNDMLEGVFCNLFPLLCR